MDHKDHIKNILKSVVRGDINEGQSMDDYLERKASQILSYVPESPARHQFSRKKDDK